ncbi:MAG: 30S ribosome-binding factor RbfA [Oscillospiraceae bacterium]|nr:30S ribosome-binding factor RbfA [Oscillospiraceae bacterium]MCC8079739.1 30S ribosome-binding factor RbfA [Oscillospiraceae bacterium]MCD8254673.1 30S ribosome-binding factor RbfA [Oscillospiraceae bacterium]MCD8343179.1 30S ribosome-binding factor RbfA [Oscillospiraceae bacterium]MCD8373792.1 30S ribosome-binding factor RbfA [Oscillospiraceae bacterium]
MPSNKLYRTNDDIQFALSRLLPLVKDPRVNQGSLVSITRVDTTGDLRYCHVWLSVLGEINEKDFMKGLKSASPWLRRELGSRLALRYTPELIFELDKSIEHGAYINKMISDLNISGDESDKADGAESEEQ